MDEIWKYVVGYEKLYKVSNLGRVKSLKRVIKISGSSYRPAYTRTHPRKILARVPVGAGYLTVVLCKNGKTEQRYVHHLVWEAFVGPIPEKEEVNHKNGKKENCRLDNLETGTHRFNIQHALENGLITKCEQTGRFIKA